MFYFHGQLNARKGQIGAGQTVRRMQREDRRMKGVWCHRGQISRRMSQRTNVQTRPQCCLAASLLHKFSAFTQISLSNAGLEPQPSFQGEGFTIGAQQVVVEVKRGERVRGGEGRLWVSTKYNSTLRSAPIITLSWNWEGEREYHLSFTKYF